MPANVELFSQVVSPAPKVYWDTSFLIDLKLFISRAAEPRLICSKNFYDLLVRNNVLNFTSIVAIQEAIHLGFFEWGIKKDMRTILDTAGKPYSDIRKFKREKPVEFNTSYQTHLPKVIDMWNFINRLGINIIYPRPFITNPAYSVSHRISNYARLLLGKYRLETNDAFHISIAKCAKIRHIISCEDGFKQVDKINLYSPR
jgi:hypothetical protein